MSYSILEALKSLRTLNEGKDDDYILSDSSSRGDMARRIIGKYKRLVEASDSVKNSTKEYLRVVVDGFPYGSNYPSFFMAYFYVPFKPQTGLNFILNELKRYVDISEAKNWSYDEFCEKIYDLLDEAFDYGYGEEFGISYIADSDNFSLSNKSVDSYIKDYVDEANFPSINEFKQVVSNIKLGKPFIYFEDPDFNLDKVMSNPDSTLSDKEDAFIKVMGGDINDGRKGILPVTQAKEGEDRVIDDPYGDDWDEEDEEEIKPANKKIRYLLALEGPLKANPVAFKSSQAKHHEQGEVGFDDYMLPIADFYPRPQDGDQESADNVYVVTKGNYQKIASERGKILSKGSYKLKDRLQRLGDRSLADFDKQIVTYYLDVDNDLTWLTPKAQQQAKNAIKEYDRTHK